MRRSSLGLAATLMTMAGSVDAETARTVVCKPTMSFERWLDGIRQEAAASGVSQRTLTAALTGLTFDPGIVARDRRQTFFNQTFLEVAAKLATPNRQQSGARALEKHRPWFVRALQQHGVPGAAIVALWALESDFGVGMGKLPVLRSLASLAYDCRRAEMFRAEFLAALRIVERGDLRPQDMIGSWAGELGQTQFLPTHYEKHAVDYDGDGRRDLMKSAPDIIGSTAAFMAHLGWQGGRPWLEEVRVPASLPWDQADLAIKHPRTQWARWGVKRPDGQPLPADTVPASLHLLMGRNGPAFLAYANFEIYRQWNQSLNYATTAAYLATRIAGGPAMSRGNGPVAPFAPEQMRELQQLLAKRGLYAGEIDGRLGLTTRAGIKAAQPQFGLPADSYPTPELLERLRR
ncbi:MAG: lytic murein transglycosylase [Hyphomicrobiaceae bacterium]